MRVGIDLELIGQEADDLGGHRGQVIGAESQVAERPELEGEAEPAGRVDAPIDLGLVRPREGVEGDQVLLGDLRWVSPQPSPFGVVEELSWH